MAQIQTYNANPIAAQATKETGFSESGAILQGVGDVLETAGKTIDTIEQANKASDANNLWAQSANTLGELSRQNDLIRDKYKEAPNPEKMNKELEEAFTRLTQPSLDSLDPASQNDYRKTASAAFLKLKENNDSWANKVSEKLSKVNKGRTIGALKGMNDDSAYQAGFQGADYKVGNDYLLRYGGNRTDLSGNELLTPNKPLDYTTARLQKDANKNYYLGAIDGMPNIDLTNVDGSVQTGTDKDGNPIVVPASQYSESGGEFEPSFWKRLKPGRQAPIEVKSRIQVGQETIDKYYTDLSAKIDSDSTLSSAEKKDLKNIASRAAEKNKINYQNGEQIVSSNITNQLDYAPTFEGMNQELDAMFREDDIFSQAQLSSESSGKFGDLTSGFNAFSLRTQKPETSANLFESLLSGNGIEGKHSYEQLQKIYAPNNTMQENAFLNKAIQSSPYLELDLGEEWKNENQGGKFNESDWYWNKLVDIYKMPEITAEERAKKTYSIGEFFVQTRKMANNGTGLIDENLKEFSDERLLGANTNEHLGLYGQAGVGREMSRMIQDVSNSKNEINNTYAPNKIFPDAKARLMESIMNTGMIKARNVLLETGDVNESQKIIEDTKFNMLQAKFDGIIDINKLEKEKQSGRQPIFTYDGVPYVYEGFNGSEIYIRNGNQRKAL